LENTADKFIAAAHVTSKFIRKTNKAHQDKMASKKKELLPTKDEQLSLSNAQALLRGNLMQMQVSELLSTVHSSDKACKKIEGWVATMAESIQNSDVFTEGTSLSQDWLDANEIKYFSLRSYDSRKVISFEAIPPSSIDIVGSLSLGTMTSPFLSCDVAVGFPAERLDERFVL
jgi:hypothetical protein